MLSKLFHKEKKQAPTKDDAISWQKTRKAAKRANMGKQQPDDEFQEQISQADAVAKDVKAGYNKKLYKDSRKKLSLGEWAKLGVCNALNIDPNTEHFGEEIWVRILNLMREAGLNDLFEIIEAFRNLSKGEGASILKTLGTIAKGVGNGFLDIFRHWKSSLQIAGAGLINIIMPEGAELKSLALDDLKEWAINFFNLNTIVGLVDVIRDKDNKHPGAKAKIKEMLLLVLDRVGSQAVAMFNPVSIIKALLGNVLSNLLSGFPGGKFLSAIISGFPGALKSMVEAVAAAMDGNFDIIANGVRTGLLRGIGKVVGLILECIPQVQPVLEGIRTALGVVRSATSFLNLDVSGVFSTVTAAVGIGKAKDKGGAAKKTFGIDKIASAKGAEGSFVENLADQGKKIGGMEIWDDVKSMGDRQAWIDTAKENWDSVKEYNPATLKGWGKIGTDTYEDAIDRAGEAESMREDGKFKNPFSLSGYKDALQGEDSVVSNATQYVEKAVKEANETIEAELERQKTVDPDDKAGKSDVAQGKLLDAEILKAGEALEAVTVPKAIRDKISGNYSRKKDDKGNTNKKDEKDTLGAVKKSHIMHYVLKLKKDGKVIYRSPVEDNFQRAVDCMVDEALDALKGKDKVVGWKSKRKLKADRKEKANAFAKGKSADFMKDLEELVNASSAEVNAKVDAADQKLHEDFIKTTKKAREAHDKKIKDLRKAQRVLIDGKEMSLASFESDYEIAQREFDRQKQRVDAFKAVCDKLKAKGDERDGKESALEALEKAVGTGAGDNDQKKQRKTLMHELKQLSSEISSLIKQRDSLRKEVLEYTKNGKMSAKKAMLDAAKARIDKYEDGFKKKVGDFDNTKQVDTYNAKKAEADKKARGGLDPAGKDREKKELAQKLNAGLTALGNQKKSKKCQDRLKVLNPKKGDIIASGEKLIDMSYTSKPVYDAVHSRLKNEGKTVLDVAIEQTVGAPGAGVIM